MFQNHSKCQRESYLARRLSEATGLPFWVASECSPSPGVPFPVRFRGEFLELVYDPGNSNDGPFTNRILHALAQEILGSMKHGVEEGRGTPWTWEKLLNKAQIQQWDTETFVIRADEYGLTGLSQGFPVLVHSSAWNPEIEVVLKNLFPYAPVNWINEPNMYLYIPIELSQSGLAQQKALGEELINQIHSLLADELGILATVFVGQLIDNDLWSGFLEVKKLAELHRRFFAGTAGLAAWNVGIASLFSDIPTDTAQVYIRGILGSLNKELVDTLKVFLETDMSITDTARILFIHRNTLTYRLERIMELTGYNPRSLKGAVHLFLALWLSPHNN